MTRALAALSARGASITRAYAWTAAHILEPATALAEPGVRATFDELGPTLPRYPSATATRAQILAAIHTAERPVAHAAGTNA